MDNENANPENENTNGSENNGNVERFVERGSERLAVPENFWDKEKMRRTLLLFLNRPWIIVTS